MDLQGPCPACTQQLSRGMQGFQGGKGRGKALREEERDIWEVGARGADYVVARWGSERTGRPVTVTRSVGRHCHPTVLDSLMQPGRRPPTGQRQLRVGPICGVRGVQQHAEIDVVLVMAMVVGVA